MPGLDGYEAAAAIRALSGRRGDVPIVAVTADAGERYRHSAINDFVLKPVDAREFGTVVCRWAGATVEREEPPVAQAPPQPGDEIIDRSVVSTLAARIGAAKTGELVDLYVTDLRDRIGRVRDAVTARDINTLRREAHDLRSTSGSLGLTRLFAVGEAIQAAALEGNETVAFAAAAKVEDISHQTIAALLAADPRRLG